MILIDIDPIKNFLQKQIAPSELAVILDELAGDYADMKLRYSEDGNQHDAAERLYFIRRLRDVMHDTAEMKGA
jgi:hypothetical protein